MSSTQSSPSFIRCNTPSTKGATTSALIATGEANVVALVSLSPSSISVSLRSGGGSTYQERDFSGPLSGFDVQTGGSFSAMLSPAAGGTSGASSIGTLSAISGTVACGGQTRGTTTVVFNGTTSKGMVSNGFDAAFVECDTFSQGISAAAIGVLDIAGTKWDAFFTATTSRLTLFASSSAGSLSLTGAPGSGATVSATGGHVTGTLTEGGTSNTVTVSGDLTCGSHANF
ncbi:MAG: hypothetical protein JOY68_10865 [Candidatus Dormibacteraeota bacterium]|nr:hypothetical protein [Candidatus Dormibacteraeota bacterium]